MSQDNHDNPSIPPPPPTRDELPPTEAPPEERTPEQAIEDAAHKLVAQMDSEEQNAPLEKGLCRAFQKAWNKVHRDRSKRLPETGALERATVIALNKTLRGR